MLDVDKAAQTFDNMIEIIEKEMIVKGVYAGDIENSVLHKGGAICDGRRYCAIGTMVVAYGIKSHEPVGARGWRMSNAFSYMTSPARDDYYDETLTAVHDALNSAAMQWARDHGAGAEDGDDPTLRGWVDDKSFYVNPNHVSPIESLFESSLYFADTENGRHDLLDIIRSAKEKVCGVTV